MYKILTPSLSPQQGMRAGLIHISLSAIRGQDGAQDTEINKNQITLIVREAMKLEYAG